MPVFVPDPPAEPVAPRIARAGDFRCASCDRTPLVGEKAILHASAEAESWACELCERSALKVARLGDVRDRVQVLPPLLGSRAA
ncbi:MAG: hypothetical protein ACR2OC_00615 [Solirubrobacterales bacterium]